MLAMFSSHDDDMMARFGSPESVAAMQAAVELALEHHTRLSHCRKLFENVAADDISRSMASGPSLGSYASFSRM